MSKKKTAVEEKNTVEPVSLLGNFVFMDKSLAILDAGIKTDKSVVLYGPGE